MRKVHWTTKSISVSRSQSRKERRRSHRSYRKQARLEEGINGVDERMAIDFTPALESRMRWFFRLYSPGFYEWLPEDRVQSLLVAIRGGTVSLKILRTEWARVERSLRKDKRHNTRLLGFHEYHGPAVVMAWLTPDGCYGPVERTKQHHRVCPCQSCNKTRAIEALKLAEATEAEESVLVPILTQFMVDEYGESVELTAEEKEARYLDLEQAKRNVSKRFGLITETHS